MDSLPWTYRRRRVVGIDEKKATHVPMLERRIHVHAEKVHVSAPIFDGILVARICQEAWEPASTAIFHL